jgi:hypothetical protein
VSKVGAMVGVHECEGEMGESLHSGIHARDKVTDPRGAAITSGNGEAVTVVESVVTRVTNGLVGTRRANHWGVRLNRCLGRWPVGQAQFPFFSHFQTFPNLKFKNTAFSRCKNTKMLHEAKFEIVE